MTQEATRPEKFGTRIASQIQSAAAVAGDRLDAAIGYTREKTDALKDSVHHLVEDSWTGLRNQAGRIHVAPLLIGLGVGFCLGWFARRERSANQ